MPATATFLAAWRKAKKSAATLVRISLTHKSGSGSLQLFLGSREVSTPAGGGDPARSWENALADVHPVHAPGGFLTNDLGLVATQFTIARRKLGPQAAGTTTLDLLKDYRWDASAIVTIQLWETGLTDFGDALTVLKNARIQSVEASAAGLTVYVRQRVDWNRPLSPATVRRARFPRAPDGSVGMPIPVVYGALRPPPMRQPFVNPYADEERIRELLTGGFFASPAVLVDPGRTGGVGNAAGRILAASHNVKALGTPNNTLYGTPCWIAAEDGKLHNVDPTVGRLFLTGTDGAGWDMEDTVVLAYMPVLGSEVEIPATPCDDPRNAMDPWNERSFAHFDFTGSKRLGYWRLGAVPPPKGKTYVKGGAVRIICYVLYRTTATATNLLFLLRNVPRNISSQQTMTASTTPTFKSITITANAWATGALPDDPWNFGDCRLEVDFTGGAAGQTADVFAVGLVVAYSPADTIVPDRLVPRTEQRIPHIGRGPVFYGRGSVSNRATYDAIRSLEFIPGVFETSGKFYANLDGLADDGSGTYTGVAAALIERAPDVMRHILAVYGLEASILTTATTFGSFTDARTDLKTWRAGDWKFATSIPQAIDLATLLPWLANQAFSWLYLDRFTDRWYLLPWRMDRSVNYAWRFSREQLADLPAVQTTPDSDVTSGVKVAHGYDWFSDTYRFECSVGSGKSVSGYSWYSRRDATLKVVASESDRLDYNIGGGPVTANLTPGNYDGLGLAAHLRSLLGTTSWGYGVEIIASFNDRLDFNDGAVKVLNLTAGSYTCESLAAALQTLFNAASVNWTVSYSRPTQKFTIGRSSGTATLLNSTGTNLARTVGKTLGFPIADTAVGTGTAATFAREEQRFWAFQNSGNIDLLFGTGTNLARSCAELIGFLPEDRTGGIPSHLGDFPKTNEEELLEASLPRWTPKRETTIEARAIYDTDTARELRMRVFAAGYKQRQIVRFSTDFAPDVERGRVIEFDADMNLVMPYPDPDTDGLWAGKRFVVVEVEQMLGPTSFATRITAVSLG